MYIIKSYYKDRHVSFETAKKLKEQGFMQLVAPWNVGYDTESNIVDSLEAITGGGYARPTLAIALEWLREEKKIDVAVEPIYRENKINWIATIYNLNDPIQTGFNVIGHSGVHLESDLTLDQGIYNALCWLELEKNHAEI